MKSKILYIYKTILERLRPKVKQNGIRNPFYSSLFYGIFDNSFKRQHFATLTGIDAFTKRGDKNIAILIRNLHRIEKGLIMPERKKVFAKEFIEETVKSFRELDLILLEENKNLYYYAKSVLNSFFEVVDRSDNTIQNALAIYNHNVLEKLPVPLKLPYPRRNVESSNVSYEDYLKLSKQRRSIRFFEQKRVERSLIEKAIEAALQAPSACNRQPFRLIIADDPETKNFLGSLPPGALSYYKNVPVFIAIIGDLSNYFSERDRHLIYIDGSLFAMSLMLALETLQLASCPINWPDIDHQERKLTEMLNLKSFERCVMFLGIGYPDPNGLIPYSQKKSSVEVIQYFKK